MNTTKYLRDFASLGFSIVHIDLYGDNSLMDTRKHKSFHVEKIYHHKPEDQQVGEFKYKHKRAFTLK